MSRIKQCSIAFILVFLFSLFLPSATLAEVVLTEQEAQMLGHELTIAKQSIANCRQELNESNRKLLSAKERLEMLSSDLETQKQNLLVQQVQLKAANESLKLQNEEHKKKVKKLSRQRNIAYTIAAVFVAVAIRK